MKKDVKENKMSTGPKVNKAGGLPSADKKGENHDKKNVPPVR